MSPGDWLTYIDYYKAFFKIEFFIIEMPAQIIQIMQWLYCP